MKQTIPPPEEHPCPLCGSQNTFFYIKDTRRNYHRCRNCTLVFVPPRFYPTPEQEKAEYDLHENSPADKGYRRFLSRMFDPMVQSLTPGCRGLDFGSGPGPTLSIMFEEAGFSMDIYDHFYAANAEIFHKRYDFITATEVVEHLFNPGDELKRLWLCLNPGGYLGIMTKRVKSLEAFKTWHYKNDLTHVCFFSRETFVFLAEDWQADIEFAGDDVVLLKKHGSSSS